MKLKHSTFKHNFSEGYGIEGKLLSSKEVIKQE
jgi:hypothetical protein